MKKFISLALCLALVFGTAALGVTAYAEDATAPATATEPATITEPETEPNPGIATQVKSIEFPEDFYTEAVVSYYISVGPIPKNIRIIFSDGTFADVENMNNDYFDFTYFYGTFKMSEEDDIHTVLAYYSSIPSDNNVNLCITIDGFSVYNEKAEFVFSFLFLDILAFSAYTFRSLADAIYELRSGTSVSDVVSTFLLDVKLRIQKFSEYRDIVRANNYQGIISLPIGFYKILMMATTID